MVIGYNTLINPGDDYQEKINNALMKLDGKDRRIKCKIRRFKDIFRRRLVGRYYYNFNDNTAKCFMNAVWNNILDFITFDLEHCKTYIGNYGCIVYDITNYSNQIDHIINKTLSRFNGSVFRILYNS